MKATAMVMTGRTWFTRQTAAQRPEECANVQSRATMRPPHGKSGKPDGSALYCFQVLIAFAHRWIGQTRFQMNEVLHPVEALVSWPPVLME
jgi:hypothetical protein